MYRNHYTTVLCDSHMFTCIMLLGVLTSVLQETQGLTTKAFVILLLVMISHNMPTFRSVVAMVAEFHSLIIPIHNTWPEAIFVYFTRTTLFTTFLTSRCNAPDETTSLCKVSCLYVVPLVSYVG